MGEQEVLEEYDGQSLDELLAMEKTHRVDSLVLAMESALDRKASGKRAVPLSPEERVIVAVENLEREVNNGGYGQFFINSSREYAGDIEKALRLIGCPKQAAIAKRAVAALKIKGKYTSDAVETALEKGGDKVSDVLSSLDDEYYACQEPIADRLFGFAKTNRAKIRLRR